MKIHRDDYDCPTINTRDLIVQQPYEDDGRWYVQEITLLDMGRFMTHEEAVRHAEFLKEKYSEK